MTAIDRYKHYLGKDACCSTCVIYFLELELELLSQVWYARLLGSRPTFGKRLAELAIGDRQA